MQALTIEPSVRKSAKLEDVPEPETSAGEVLVQTVAIGICGTDLEIVEGEYGTAPPGAKRLILGHESIGRVLEAPAQSGFRAGDWVAGIVRHPDPVPCPSCAAGEWDMCQNGEYTEHGIKGLHGFAVQRFRADPRFLVKVDSTLEELGVLLEPASVLAKAWEQAERIAARSTFRPRRVLVAGAGPIGLLAALLGRQRGLEVDVLDRATEGPKPELVKALGATYHAESLDEKLRQRGWDLIFECTGSAELMFELIPAAAPDGVLCLTSVSSAGKRVKTDPGSLNRDIVLENKAIFGSVNANRRHYEQAAEALARADRDWLARLVTRRVPLAEFERALEREDDDVKTILAFG